ncbi:MAG: response regulator, partial [Candidatus Thermoplasmatota archaeon]
MSIKTLLVDDDRSLLSEGKKFLERINEEIEVLTVSSAERALEMIDEEELDVIVSDYKMPDIDGLEFLEELREERDSDVPFIIFTGKGEEEVAMKALNLGVGRYIKKGNDPKSQYGVLADAIVQEYEYWGARRELERSEVKSRQKYEKMFHETPLGAFHYDEQGIIMECNDRFVEIVGSSREDVIGLDMLNDLENDELVEEVRSSLEKGEGYYEGEYTSVTGNKTIEVRVFLRGIEDEEGQIKSGIGLVEDNTERKEYEQELKRKERYLDHTPTFVTVIDEEGEMKYHSYP